MRLSSGSCSSVAQHSSAVGPTIVHFARAGGGRARTRTIQWLRQSSPDYHSENYTRETKAYRTGRTAQTPENLLSGVPALAVQREGLHKHHPTRRPRPTSLSPCRRYSVPRSPWYTKEGCRLVSGRQAPTIRPPVRLCARPSSRRRCGVAAPPRLRATGR